eukprot:6490863-Amphidinium_carterae.1
MASAQLCHQHVHRVQLEQALNTLSVGLEKVAYAEWMSWDETPLKVGLKARASSGGKLGHTQCVGLATAGVTMLPKLGLNSNQDSRICKVLQTQQSVGMLIKCEDKYVKLIVEQACPLQVLERNSATILRSALLSLSGSSKWSNGFGFKSRVSSYDKAPYNSKASRSVSTDRQGWCSLDLTCEVHDSARAFGSTFNTFMSSHISGLISVALCLREAGAFNIFRECLREEIRSRVKVIHGLPSEHSTLHKTRLMDAFFASGSKSIPQMMLLSLLPNGDWQAHEVEHYIEPGKPVPHLSTLTCMLEAGLCHALLNRRPRMWARHRWTGAEVATDEVSLLECVHRLMSTTFMRFMWRSSSVGASVCLKTSTEISMQPDNTNHEGVASSDHGVETADVDQYTAQVCLEGGTSEDVAGRSVQQSWADENAANRRKACQWLQNSPLDSLCIMRLCMEPLRLLLARQFEVASFEWELKERAKAITAMETGQTEGVASRDYQVTIACSLKLEEKYFNQLGSLFTNTDMWQLIQEGSRTVEVNHLIFKLLSRQGCCIEMNIRHPHKQMPFALYQILHNPMCAEEMSRTEACRMDSFATKLLEQFPGYSGTSCFHTIELNAILATTSIACVESRHASIRREAFLKSAHTWTEEIVNLSAAWTLQQLRRGRSRLQMGKPGKTVAQTVPLVTARAKKKAMTKELVFIHLLVFCHQNHKAELH